MKTKKLLLSLFGIVILNLFISSCKKDSNGDSGLPSITTDDQASSVAFCICSTVGGYILDRFVDDKTWNHETKNGYSSGTITINGSYHHTETQYGYNYPEDTYEFDNVTVVCSNLNDDTNGIYPSITGNASISGTIYEQQGSSSSDFSGNWTMTGQMTLSKKYNDQVSFTFYFYEDYFTSSFSGTLINKAGKTFDIVSEFKK